MRFLALKRRVYIFCFCSNVSICGHSLWLFSLIILSGYSNKNSLWPFSPFTVIFQNLALIVFIQFLIENASSFSTQKTLCLFSRPNLRSIKLRDRSLAVLSQRPA